jgi:hypothetical protein
VDRVAEREGEAPEGVGLTCPASWQGHRRQLLLQAARGAGIGTAELVPEPEAAALRYASLERLDAGAVVGVYDLGGGTFDAAVLRRDPDGFRLLGAAGGLDQLGGLDVDDLVVRHVLQALGPQAPDEDDLDDPDVADAVSLLRRDCVEAKEALSDDTETVVPVRLPGVRTRVRLTRSELEELVRPLLERTVEAFRATLDDARVPPDQLTAVLLAGGASRMPLVVHMLTQAFGRPLLVDAHPKHVVAAGAALMVADVAAVLHEAPQTASAAPLTPSRPLVVGDNTQVLDLAARTAGPPTEVVPPVAPPDVPQEPPSAEQRGGRRPAVVAGAGALVALAAVLGATWAVGASREPSAPVRTPGSTPTSGPTVPSGSTRPTTPIPTPTKTKRPPTASVTSHEPTTSTSTSHHPSPSPSPSRSPSPSPSPRPSRTPTPSPTTSPTPSPSPPITPTPSPVS